MLASVDRNSRLGIDNDVTLSWKVGFNRRVGSVKLANKRESLLERKPMGGRGDVGGLVGG